MNVPLVWRIWAATFVVMLLVLLIFYAGRLSFAAEPSPTDYSSAIQEIEQAVADEMSTWTATGACVALVDDQQMVYSGAFGTARKNSIFRAGSISKVFNAVAIMQLVEAGKLDLDAPLDRYAADLVPAIPFENCTPPTLRQILCHRSGIEREAPVGGYLDGSGPSLLQTVDSVAQCPLVTPPGAKTRYSNLAPSFAGRILANVAEEPYPQYQRKHVLEPLAMHDSGWLLEDIHRDQLLPAMMQVADGRGGFTRQAAPIFDLGTVPAGNLFTTAEDLARFAMMLAATGNTPGGRLLSADSLAKMFTPQLVDGDSGFGLGFMVGKFRDHQTIGHMGAVYGFTSSLLFLPQQKLAVVILTNEDVFTGRVQRLTNLAIAAMLKAKLHEEPPAAATAVTLPAEELAPFAGDYESESFWAKLEVNQGKLVANISGQSATLTPTGPLSFLLNSRLDADTPASFRRDDQGRIAGFSLGKQEFVRVANNIEIPQGWKPYLGSYGPEFIPLVISSRHGHLYAMTENMVDYRLKPVTRHVFAMPAGLYADEYAVFITNAAGTPQAVCLANMYLPRRTEGVAKP
jgi:CubicO group peptidase (beta-lactamase class C family)